jgi:hypothetical protein
MNTKARGRGRIQLWKNVLGLEDKGHVASVPY